VNCSTPAFKARANVATATPLVPLEIRGREARDGVVIVERILGAPLIGRLERLQHAFGEDDVRRGERPEKVLRDVPAIRWRPPDASSGEST